MKLLFLSLAFVSLSLAQSFEGAVSAGISQIRNSDIGSGYTLDNGFRLALRMNLNTKKYLGYELGYAYNRTHLGSSGFGTTQSSSGMAIHQGFGAVLLHATGVESRIRPFVAGGIGFSNFVPPGQTAQYGQGETKFALNYGGGVKVKLFGPWQLRFDIRQFNTGMPFGLKSGRFLQNEISAGIGYTL